MIKISLRLEDFDPWSTGNYVGLKFWHLNTQWCVISQKKGIL